MADESTHVASAVQTAARVKHVGTVLVIGLGRFGSALARTLVELDYEVLAVDFDLARVQEHAHEIAHVVQADSTSVRALRQLGAADIVTAVVCIGTDIEASVLTAAALVDLGVPNIWAKAITAAHGRILERVGCHHVVFPEAEMGTRVAHLITGSLLEYLALDDDFTIVETTVPKGLDGLRLGGGELRAKYDLMVVCIKKEGTAFTYATADTVLAVGDLIVVAGHRAHLHRFADAP